MAINAYKNALRNNHPDLAIGYYNISIIYKKLKECIKAKEFSVKSITIQEQLDYHSSDLTNYKNNLKSIESNIKKQKNTKFKDKGRFCKDM